MKAYLSVDQHLQSGPPPRRQCRRASPEQSQTAANISCPSDLLDSEAQGITSSLATVVWKAPNLHALLTCVGLI